MTRPGTAGLSGPLQAAGPPSGPAVAPPPVFLPIGPAFVAPPSRGALL